MKYICKTEFVHSGVRFYSSGMIYDLSEEQVKELTKMKALGFFAPVGKGAVTTPKEAEKA